MDYILISIFLFSWVGVSLFRFALNTDYGPKKDIAGVSGIFICLASAILLFIYSIASYQWFGAEYKVKILNAEYGTHYTQSDIFWASDVIDTIKQIDRNRIEINGDILGKENAGIK